MEKQVIEALALRAGLERALAEFPEDVAAAAKLAEAHGKALGAPKDRVAEPWPPMRVAPR